MQSIPIQVQLHAYSSTPFLISFGLEQGIIPEQSRAPNSTPHTTLIGALPQGEMLLFCLWHQTSLPACMCRHTMWWEGVLLPSSKVGTSACRLRQTCTLAQIQGEFVYRQTCRQPSTEGKFLVGQGWGKISKRGWLMGKWQVWSLTLLFFLELLFDFLTVLLFCISLFQHILSCDLQFSQLPLQIVNLLLLLFEN